MNIVLIGMLGVMMFLTLNKMYFSTNAYLMTKKDVDKFKNVPNDLRIVNLGSSYAKYGIVYDSFAINGFNFALAPQSLKYDYKVIRQYSNHLASNSIVIITLGICEFLLDDYHHEQSNMKYYFFMDGKYINNFSKLKRWLYLYFPLLIMPWKVKYIFKDIRLTEQNTQENKGVSVERLAEERIKEWQDEFGDLEIGKLDVTDIGRVRETLMEMIDYCNEKEWKPILVIPPVTRKLKVALQENKVDLQKILYDNIGEDVIGNTPVLDYFNNSDIEDEIYFISADFLSEQGSRLFSGKLFADIERIFNIKLRGNENGK